MKRIRIIFSFVLVVLFIGIMGFIFWNDRITSTIILDINPSIEIKLDRKERVKSIIAQNEDAKKIINQNLKGKFFDEVMHTIAENVIEKGYAEEDQVVIILYSKGIDNSKVENSIRKSFGEKSIFTEIISIDNITNEDKKLSEKYNISISKAAYINLIKKEKENIPIENLVNKPSRELKEVESFGFYCEDGYILEGNECLIEIERVSASDGDVCPRGYYELNGICYEEVGIEDTDILECNDEMELRNDKCVRTFVEPATPEYYCEKGELKSEHEIRLHGWKGGSACVDSSEAVAPTLRCLLEPHMIMNGKCYVGPAPVINGGCPGNDVLASGGCYSLDPEDQWQCPDGSIYEKSKDTYVDLCPDTLIYRDPLIKGYTCNNDFELQNGECVKEEIQDAWNKRVCPSGYTMVDNDRCINKDKTTNKISGKVCTEDNARLKGDSCIIYERIEAKHD